MSKSSKAEQSIDNNIEGIEPVSREPVGPNGESTTSAIERPQRGLESAESVGGGAADDPFSLENLRLEETAVPLAIEPTLTGIAVGKPTAYEFVRTFPNSDVFVELWDPFDRSGSISGTSYLLSPNLRFEIPQYISYVRLHVAITVQGRVFIWRIVERDKQGRQSSSAASQQIAAVKAREKWINIEWPSNGGRSYLMREGEDALGQPQWPSSARKLGLQEDRQPVYIDYIRLAYGDTIVTSLTDPRIKRLLQQ